MRKLKVALDEHIAPRVVSALEAAYGDRGFEFIQVRSLVGPRTKDEVWATTFQRFGGSIVLSGDKNIGRRPHQIIAFKENDLICFFMQSRWSQLSMSRKLAHLIFWWPRIETALENCQPGDCFWVPAQVGDFELKEVNVPEDVLSDARERQSKKQ